LETQPGVVQTTIDLFQQFDGPDIFRALPPETILELGKKTYEVIYETGETLVWENENNQDVFVLIDGKLDAFVRDSDTGTSINPGDVFGEIAWLTNGSRAATVRAAMRSTCLVIKDNDLKFLAQKYPSILMSIAGTVARRFRDIRKL